MSGPFDDIRNLVRTMPGPDAETAARLVADLRFFEDPETAARRVLSYPSSEATPFVDVAPDRRTPHVRATRLTRGLTGFPHGIRCETPARRLLGPPGRPLSGFLSRYGSDPGWCAPVDPPGPVGE